MGQQFARSIADIKAKSLDRSCKFDHSASLLNVVLLPDIGLLVPRLRIISIPVDLLLGSSDNGWQPEGMCVCSPMLLQSLE